MIKNLVLLALLFSTSYILMSQEECEITLSHTAGFYDSPFYLKLNCDDCDLQFAYSYDDAFISFTDSIYIDTTRSIVLRHEVNDEFYDLGVHSFFVGFETKFKVISLNISEDFLYDNVLGLYVPGHRAYYDTTVSHYRNANWSYKHERLNHVEIFNEDGDRIIQQNSGLRIFGGMTRYYPEKSFRIIARDKYGLNRFNAAIFGSDTVAYKHLILRHSGNDYKSLRFKDSFITSLAAESGLDVQQSSPAHLFVNSEYWGVYNIREKINKYYLANNYDIPLTGIDILQGYQVLDCGEKSSYLNLLSYVKKHDLSVEENYEYVSGLMDTRNFINFWVHQTFYANPDVRGNIRYWRSDSLDGKFRWIVYDTDLGFSSTFMNDNMIKLFSSSSSTRWFNPTWSSFLLRNLLKNEGFKNDLILQYSIIGNTILSKESLLDRIDAFKTLYEEEMLFHFENRRKFQRNQGSVEKWNKHIDKLIMFAEKRPLITEKNLVETFKLSEKYTLKLSVENPQHGTVSLNNNIISGSNFSGYFFTSIDLPILIQPDIGYSNVGYSNLIINPSDSLLVDDTLRVLVSFKHQGSSPEKIVINEVSIEDQIIELFNQDTTLTNLQGWTFCVNYSDSSSSINVVDSLSLQPNSYYAFSAENENSTAISCVKLYDTNNLLADSVSFDTSAPVADSAYSYSRTIPFDSIDGELPYWEMSYTPTHAAHNIHYTDLLLKQHLDMEAERQKALIIRSTIITLSFLLVILFRKKIVLFTSNLFSNKS